MRVALTGTETALRHRVAELARQGNLVGIDVPAPVSTDKWRMVVTVPDASPLAQRMARQVGVPSARPTERIPRAVRQPQCQCAKRQSWRAKGAIVGAVGTLLALMAWVVAMQIDDHSPGMAVVITALALIGLGWLRKRSRHARAD